MSENPDYIGMNQKKMLEILSGEYDLTTIEIASKVYEHPVKVGDFEYSAASNSLHGLLKKKLIEKNVSKVTWSINPYARTRDHIGPHQRQILNILENQPNPTLIEIARKVYQMPVKVGDPEYAATSRSLGELLKRGFVGKSSTEVSWKLAPLARKRGIHLSPPRTETVINPKEPKKWEIVNENDFSSFTKTVVWEELDEGVRQKITRLRNSGVVFEVLEKLGAIYLRTLYHEEILKYL